LSNTVIEINKKQLFPKNENYLTKHKTYQLKHSSRYKIKWPFVLIGILTIFNNTFAQKLLTSNLKDKEIYTVTRITTSPSKGETPKFNSPSFQWPSKKKATYSIRISTSKIFAFLIFMNNWHFDTQQNLYLM
jgi:hypothetical protein